MRHLPVISVYGYVAVDRFKRYGRYVGVANLFLDQSIRAWQIFFWINR